MSEHANTSNTDTPAVTGQQPDSAPAVAPKPVAAPVIPHGFVGPKVAPTLVSAPATLVIPVAAQSIQVYVIKAGDTLSRIARQHHTTVKALKAANNLDTDSIAIGATLKLPSA